MSRCNTLFSCKSNVTCLQEGTTPTCRPAQGHPSPANCVCHCEKIAVWFTNGSCYGFAASSLSSNRHEIGAGSKAPKNKTFPQIRILLRLNKALHCVL